MDIYAFWKAVLEQKPDTMRIFLHPDARIFWHCSNESFSSEEFIQANCTYPGEWDGCIKHVEETEHGMITVVHVYSKDKKLSFHVASFFTFQEGKVIKLDEYWGDDIPAPQWRQDLMIGYPIYSEV